MNVFLLATCRKPELLPFTLLVFKTLRVGFPAASVSVCINPMDSESQSEVIKACDSVGANYQHIDLIHHLWAESLVKNQTEPFWIVDTDMIFFNSMEDQKFDLPLAGYRIPEWRDSFSGCVTRARLHTSLLYVDPVKVMAKVYVYESKIANTEFTPKVNLFHPLVVPLKKEKYFYDTCSMLYHAVGGESFTDQQKSRYFHFHWGTIPDVVIPRIPSHEAYVMTVNRGVILNNPELGRGRWREQEQYFLSKPA